MIELNKDSLLNRRVREFHGHLAGDLCSYVRQVVVAVWVGVLMLAVMGAMLWSIIMAFGGIWHLLFGFGAFFSEGTLDCMVVFAAFWGTLATIALLIWLNDKRKERKRGGTPKPPGIIAEYIKAKKGKYCPKIKWI